MLLAPTPALPARGRELSLRSLKPVIDTQRHSIKKHNPMMLTVSVFTSWLASSFSRLSLSLPHSSLCSHSSSSGLTRRSTCWAFLQGFLDSRVKPENDEVGLLYLSPRCHCEPLQGVWQSRISKFIYNSSRLLRTFLCSRRTSWSRNDDRTTTTTTGTII